MFRISIKLQVTPNEFKFLDKLAVIDRTQKMLMKIILEKFRFPNYDSL